jgi:ABC-type phosphate/phosphonate transport system permease subunit
MNRSITNVLFGGIAPTAQSQTKVEGEITKTTADEASEMLVNAENVIIVSTGFFQLWQEAMREIVLSTFAALLHDLSYFQSISLSLEAGKMRCPFTRQETWQEAMRKMLLSIFAVLFARLFVFPITVVSARSWQAKDNLV